METNNKHKEMEKPLLISAIADNGQHSHWVLVDNETGDKLWSENGIECKAVGYPVKETDEVKALKQQNEELLNQQTTKLQADKDRLAALAKNQLETINADIFIMRNRIEDIEHDELLAQAEIQAKIILQTLSECGYNI